MHFSVTRAGISVDSIAALGNSVPVCTWNLKTNNLMSIIDRAQVRSAHKTISWPAFLPAAGNVWEFIRLVPVADNFMDFTHETA